MIGREFRFHNGKKGAALAIRVEGGKKNSHFKKVLQDGTVVISLKKNQQDPNKDLIQFLSGKLGIAQNKLEIIAGKDGTEKLLSVLDVTPARIQQLILEVIA